MSYIVEGYRVSFERRRYGSQLYTWAYLHMDGLVVSLGDPWPCTFPKLVEVEYAVRQEISRRMVNQELFGVYP